MSVHNYVQTSEKQGIGAQVRAARACLRAARDAEPDDHPHQFMTEVVGRLEATAVDAS